MKIRCSTEYNPYWTRLTAGGRLSLHNLTDLGRRRGHVEATVTRRAKPFLLAYYAPRHLPVHGPRRPHGTEQQR